MIAGVGTDSGPGAAGVITETSYDLAAVRHHLDAALAVNPKHTRALRVRASIEIDLLERKERVGGIHDAHS